MAIGFELQGVQQTLNALELWKTATGKKAEQGLKKAGMFLLRKSQQVCPVDTGALKNSGRMHTSGSGFNMIVWIEYLQAYAIYVHENTQAYHRPPTQAKFVEGPMRRYAAQLRKIVEDELKRK